VALGTGEHPLELHWHLAPGLSPQPHDTFAGGDGAGLRLLSAGVGDWSREVLEDWWSPAYGTRAPACTLRFRRVAQLPTEVATLLVPGDVAEGNEILACLESVGPAPIGAYRYMTADSEHWFCFARQPGAWQAGAWSSDAEFLYSMVSRDGSHSKLICCNATSVRFAGQQIVSCPTLVVRCEIICNGEQFETFSAEPGVIVNEAAARTISIEPHPATPATILAPGRNP